VKRFARLGLVLIPVVALTALVVVGVVGRVRSAAQSGDRHSMIPHGEASSALLPNGWKITPVGKHVALPGDMPLAMAASPDGKYLLTVTGGYHDEDVNVIDMASGALIQSLDVDKAWAGMCFDPSGKTVYVAAGGGADQKTLDDLTSRKAESPARLASLGQTVLRFGFEDGKLTPQGDVPIAALQGKKHWTAGLAMGKDGALYVAETESDSVYRLGGSDLTIQTVAKVGYRPYACALSPDGGTLAVSNWGDGSVSLIDSATMQERVRVPVGSHPNQLVWGKDGRLFTACAGSNLVSVITGGKAVETIKTSLRPTDPVGSTPDALALSPDGQRLYVADADNNDVAVVDLSNHKESRVLGFIPTAWYPSALAVSPDGRRLFVGTGKGLQFRANDVADGVATRKSPYDDGRTYKYIDSLLNGTVSIVDLPDAARLAGYTRQVRADVPAPPNAGTGDAHLHSLWGPKGPIKHIVYIIRENRTYDEVFGDIKTGNGDPDLVLFGQTVTPNAHALAGQYVLLDNLYCNGEVSEDGHQWCDAAYATDFTERATLTNYSGRGEPDADDRLVASPAGYLWDNCRRHGVSYYSYGEAADFKSSPDTPPIFQGSQGLAGHASADYAAFDWFKGPRDLGRADIFIRDLHAAETSGQWPQFMVMSLPEDHTQGLSTGGFTPSADVAENDQALGKIVDAVSHSKFWSQTAIFVIEDDAQDGPDHVDAHRTVGLVISPYIRPGVDSTMYTTASFVRTMELMLGLPPMTQFDADATPLGCLVTVPNPAAYTLLPPQTDLDARNPRKGAGARASALLDFSAPDRADPDALNAILWNALKPGVPLPAPVRSARLTAVGRPLPPATGDDQ
jgi:YVTN family beta-propeller protein